MPKINSYSGGSAITAAPQLQLLDEDQADTITKGITDVVTTKMKTFTPKEDKKTTWKMVAVTIAIFAIAVMVAVAAALSGSIVAGAASGTLLLLGLGTVGITSDLWDRSGDRKKHAKKVDKTYNSAARQHLTQAVRGFDSQSEVPQSRAEALARARVQNQQQANAAARRLAQQPIASAPSLADGMSREESEALGF